MTKRKRIKKLEATVKALETENDMLYADEIHERNTSFKILMLLCDEFGLKLDFTRDQAGLDAES